MFCFLSHDEPHIRRPSGQIRKISVLMERRLLRRHAGHRCLLAVLAIHGPGRLTLASQTECFNHENCSDTTSFCSWVPCYSSDGTAYKCGACRPCSMCLCNTDSIDFVCPASRCPAQSISGMRYWQGSFFSSTTISSNPPLACHRRLRIAGNTVSLVQIPVSNTHPANSARIDLPNTVECPAYARSGVLVSTTLESNGQHALRVIITSEGIDIPCS
jgi:hypothetical protein